MFNRVVACIKRKIPEYEYEQRDFELWNVNDVITIKKWELSIDIPTDSELKAIPQEEVDEVSRYKRCCVVVDTCDLKYIKKPAEGSLVYCKGAPMIFKDKVWVNLLDDLTKQIDVLEARLNALSIV